MNKQTLPPGVDGVRKIVNDNDMKMTPSSGDGALVTVITSKEPKTLTKRFWLKNGSLQKSGGGVLVSGRASVRDICSLQDFAALLKTLRPNQALTYGVPRVEDVALVTQHQWVSLGKPDDPLPRTNETFSWPEGQGVMMIDYDPEDGKSALTADELVAAIKAAAPNLSGVAMLSWPSASSWIKNKETDEWLKEGGGLRLYLMVEDARDIPRAGQVLFDRLWLAGRGHVKISSAGSMLLRTLVDGAVWQSSRLDFAAGAKCTGPLVQDRGEPMLIAGKRGIVDTKKALADLNPHEQKIVQHLQSEARTALKDKALEVREVWLERQGRKMAGPEANDEAVEQAKAQAAKSLDTRVLSGGFVIDVKIDGRIKELTVDDLLDTPLRFDRAKTRDPLEPGYDGGRLIGMLYLDGPVKTLHSFARGGATYRLTRDLTDVRVPKGKLAEAVEATLLVLRDQDTLFDLGDELVLQDGGRLHPLNEHGLSQFLGTVIQYCGTKEKGERFDLDPPPNLARRILAMRSRRRLKPLTAVITAPTLRLDGTVLDVPGYDQSTELYLHSATGTLDCKVLERPSRQECEKALDKLWHPFNDFPFVDSVDRGVMLAALLTATVRAVLPTAPAFAFDAPIQGSGKSLLASCMSALAGDKRPSVYPHTIDEAEIRKRLLSVLRTGTSAMIWDNVLGVFDSASMAALLTSDQYSDRILGVSQSATFPNRLLVTITGNNLVLAGDMARRVLVARIDPHTDTPHAREFDLDPLAYVKANRLELVSAALTLMRGWLSCGAKPARGRMASFEGWNDLVRNTVAWIDSDIRPGDFEDPMSAIDRAMENDPELDALSELLAALEENFGSSSFRAQQVMEKVAKLKDPVTRRSSQSDSAEFRLYEALITLNERAVNTSASLGKTLKFRKDRMVEGRVLRQSEDKHRKTSLWRVAEVAQR